MLLKVTCAGGEMGCATVTVQAIVKTHAKETARVVARAGKTPRPIQDVCARFFL